jgi:hypothetical protein
MSSFSYETATMQTTAARLGIEERQLELTKFLMAEDPLPVVLRAHIHIEEELVAFITGQGHPKKAVPSKYAHRVELALKLGLPDEFKKQLAVLGALRNRFAHRANAAIETSDAEKFDAAHEPGDTVVEYAYNSKLNDSVRKPSVHDLEPKERVVLHIVTLWAGIAVAAARAKGAALERARARRVLPPPSPPIEATATEQKNDYYNDKKRGHVHGFSVLSQSLSPGILDPARWALNIAGRIFVATPASESVRCSRSKHGRAEEELDRL